MANEKITIAQDKARLSVIGRSYPDELTDSGDGLDLPDIIIDELEDLDIDLPDIPDDVDIIIGLDDDGIPEIIWVDPDTGDIEECPLDDLDWDDFLDDFPYDDLLLDIDICTIDSLISIDNDFNINMDDLPTSIEVIFPPNKTEYVSGQAISKDGLYIYAYKSDGTVWRGNERVGDKYISGRVPNDELILDPKVADISSAYPRFPDVNSMRISGWNQYAWLFGEPCYFNTSAPIGIWYDSGAMAYFGSNSPFSSEVQLCQYRGTIYAIAYPTGVGRVKACAPDAGIYGYHGSVGTRWGTLLGGPTFSLVPESDVDPTQADEIKNNIITVSWPRPGDGMILTTSFESTVKPGGGGR